MSRLFARTQNVSDPVQGEHFTNLGLNKDGVGKMCVLTDKSPYYRNGER